MVASNASRSPKGRAIRRSEQEGRTVVFPAVTLDALAGHAAARRCSANELARRIVETVLHDNLIDAVLDDAEVTGRAAA